MVRLRRLPRRLRQGADDQGPHLRHRGPRHRRRRRGESRCGIPHPADLRPDDAGPAGARAVPPGHRAAASPRRHRHPRRPRPARRLGLARRLAHRPAVGQPRAVRHRGPAVRARRRLLRLHPARPCASSSPSSRSSSRSRSSPAPSRTTSTAASSCPAAGRRRGPPTCTSVSSARSSPSPAPRRTGSTATPCSTERGSLLTGITYTDDKAVLPTKAILAVAAVMCAGFFLAAIWSRSWRLPITGVALLVVTAVLVGGAYPALIQSLRVKPSEKSLEAEYIGRNIDATSTAFGLDRVKRIQNPAPPETARQEDRARRRHRHPRGARHRPQRRRPHLPPARGPARLLRLPRHPRRRPVPDRRVDARRRRRRPRDQPRRAARQPAQLAQRPHDLHPRLRLLRRLRQPAHERGRPRLLRGRRPQRDRGVPAADLLRRALAVLLRGGCAQGRAAPRVRLPRRWRGRRPGQQHLRR